MERWAAANVVGVAVRIDERIEWCISPRANCMHDVGAGTNTRCIERNEAVAGVPGDAMAETLHDRKTVGEFIQLV
jgi:hypothetical protein